MDVTRGTGTDYGDGAEVDNIQIAVSFRPGAVRGWEWQGRVVMRLPGLQECMEKGRDVEARMELVMASDGDDNGRSAVVDQVSGSSLIDASTFSMYDKSEVWRIPVGIDKMGVDGERCRLHIKYSILK